MNLITFHVLCVVFVATLIRSSFGFGEALVAVPLLALRIPVTVAAPLAVLLSITVAAVVVVQDWREVHLASAGWLLAASLVGIPLGLALLVRADARLVKSILGIVIISFSGYSLLGRTPLELTQDRRRWLLGFGFCAGVLGGAYGMNGPPLVIYGSLRRWSAQRFRATLQGYFLPASLLVFAGYYLSGLCVPAVLHYYLLCLPLTLMAIFLGRSINRRLRGRTFLLYVHVGLILIGAILLIQAIRLA